MSMHGETRRFARLDSTDTEAAGSAKLTRAEVLANYLNQIAEDCRPGLGNCLAPFIERTDPEISIAFSLDQVPSKIE